MKTRRIQGWHFLPDDRRLQWGTREVVTPGQVYECKFPYTHEGRTFYAPTLCAAGMHASKRAIDALRYAPGAVACRVAVWGNVNTGSDKLVGQYRMVSWMLDATALLHEFACRSAEDAAAPEENPDPRVLEAIAAKRKWLRGELTDNELAAARAATRAAARAAAEAAAGAATWAAEWAAARAAAEAATGAATWAAAWAARRSKKMGAAWDAVWAAAWAAQNRRLTSMLVAAHRKAARQET
jgi:hypothetical protein